MAIPTYTPGYPPDGSSLGQTKKQIRDNLDGTFDTLSVDHRNQNQTNPGYHTVIHQVTQAGSGPSAISGVNQLFSLVPPSNVPPNGDTQLFSLTGMGGLQQMTGNQALGDGYVWCSGILLQWGTFNTAMATLTSYSVMFTPPFPNACFKVFLTGASSSSFFYISAVPTASGFTARPSEGSSTSPLYWFAIGN